VTRVSALVHYSHDEHARVAIAIEDGIRETAQENSTKLSMDAPKCQRVFLN